MRHPAKPILPMLGAGGEKLTARFWAKIDRRGQNECWPWRGEKYSHGYGRFVTTKGDYRAHRVAWVIVNGVEPDPLNVVMHACDNRPCCNPAHLTVGSNHENILDCIAKGRFRIGGKKSVRATHCHAGHEFNAANTYVKSNGCRRCRACDRVRERAKRMAQKVQP